MSISEMDQSAVALNRLHSLPKEGDPAFERMKRLREKVSLIRFIPDAQIANRNVYKYVYGLKDWDEYLKPNVNHQESELLAGWCGEGLSIADTAQLFQPHLVEHVYGEDAKRVPEDKPRSSDAVDKLEIITHVFAPENKKVREILQRALIVGCRDSGLANEISRLMTTKFENEEHLYYARRGERGYIQSGTADNMMVNPYIDAYIPLLHDRDGKFLNCDSIFESVVDQLVRYAQPYIEEEPQQEVAQLHREVAQDSVALAPETPPHQPTESVIPLDLLLDVFAQVPNGDEAVDAALKIAHLTPDQRVLVLTQLKEMTQRVLASQEIRSEVAPTVATAVADTLTQEAKTAELQERVVTLEGQLKDMKEYALLYDQAQEQIRTLQQELAQKRASTSTSSAPNRVVMTEAELKKQEEEDIAWKKLPLSTRLEELKKHYTEMQRLLHLVEPNKIQEWKMMIDKWKYLIDYYEKQQNIAPVLRKIIEMIPPDDKVMFDAFYQSVNEGKPLPCPYADQVYNTFSIDGSNDQRYQFLLSQAKSKELVQGEKGEEDFHRRYIRNFIAPSVFSFFIATNDIAPGQLHQDVFAARNVLKEVIALGSEDRFTVEFLGNPDRWANSLIDRPTGDIGVELDITQGEIVNKVLDDITSGIVDFHKILREKYPSITPGNFIKGIYESVLDEDVLSAIPTFLNNGWNSCTNLSQYRTYQGLSSFLLAMAANPKKFEMGRFINTEG